jgi:hypothetical protein
LVLIFDIFIIISEKNANGLVNKASVTSNSSFLPKIQKNNSQVMKRRAETFAEAEQRLKTKQIEIGIIGSGEIAGLTEILFDLPSYMQSVKCLEDCDVYSIDKRSFDRLIAKRNPACVTKMKEFVYMKLMARNNRLVVPIDLYRSIQFNIEMAKSRRPSLINTN